MVSNCDDCDDDDDDGKDDDDDDDGEVDDYNHVYDESIMSQLCRLEFIASAALRIDLGPKLNVEFGLPSEVPRTHMSYFGPVSSHPSLIS